MSVELISVDGKRLLKNLTEDDIQPLVVRLGQLEGVLRSLLEVNRQLLERVDALEVMAYDPLGLGDIVG